MEIENDLCCVLRECSFSYLLLCFMIPHRQKGLISHSHPGTTHTSSYWMQFVTCSNPSCIDRKIKFNFLSSLNISKDIPQTRKALKWVPYPEHESRASNAPGQGCDLSQTYTCTRERTPSTRREVKALGYQKHLIIVEILWLCSCLQDFQLKKKPRRPTEKPNQHTNPGKLATERQRFKST